MNITDAYKNLTNAGLPLIKVYLNVRKRKGKEDLSRFGEREGIPSIKRPKGKIIWMHGASVGETLSMLPLINLITEKYPDYYVMVTSGTITSAEIMKKRLPERAFHQYIPVDIYAYAERFINYWKPHVALWFESDFWPNLLYCAKKSNVPVILLNGRISDRSFKRWQMFPSFSKELQSLFTMSLGQTKEDADRLRLLGAKETDSVGNLKFAMSDIPFDEEKLHTLQEQIGNRPVFLAASTHFGEETIIAEIHKELKNKIPELLTIIVPRHQTRGNLIKEDLIKMKLNVSQRTQNQGITENTDIYLADTIGEMGIFYRLAEVCFIGGSLVKHGGQNFLEPFKLSTAVIAGPYMYNFKEMTEKALKQKAIYQIENKDDLYEKAFTLLTNYKEKEVTIRNAKEFAQAEAEVLNLVFQKIKKWLD